MVMAGNENVPGTLADDTLSARLQWLRQRREALQEKLTQKNSELKNLCVEEAEITGVLPPEIPLEPGESPPTFRKRVGAIFICPPKLTNKLKTTDTEESELELERQVQLGIVETALGVVNDPTESKATRRKQRLVYQQSQRRLQELETKLNFIRQSRGKSHRPTQLTLHTENCVAHPLSLVNVKHRTKKPRPPLDNTGSEINATKFTGRSVIHETGISLSPLAPDEKCNTYSGHGYEEQLPVPSVYNHHSGTYSGINSIDQPNIKIVEHDLNDNHNIYILPEHYRTRTYSHGSGGSRNQNHCQDTEKTYRPYVPNTYTEDERQARYRQFQQQHLQKQQHQLLDQNQSHRRQYNSPEYNKQLDSTDIFRRTGHGSYEREFRTSHYTPITDYHIYYKNNSQSQPLQRRDRDILSGSTNALRHTGGALMEAPLPSGYWVRHDDEIVWISTDEQPTADRFGSLDRRKRNAQYNGNIGVNTDMQSRYRTVSVAGTKSSASNTAVSSHQHHSVHLLPLSEQSIPASKMLLRTQSLGSVETWHSSHSHDSHDSKDLATEYVNRKGRQKEWYETALDSGVGMGLDNNLISAQKNISYQSSPPPTRVKTGTVNNENIKDSQITGMSISPVNRHKKDKSEERQYMQQTHARYDQLVTRPKILEIPAESKPSREICDDTIRPLGSPQNCTVVQAGKYQPYREVTKPFEMSDFYKYSIKFRKRNEAPGPSQVGNDSLIQENRSADCGVGSSELCRDPNSYNLGQNTTTVATSPVQKKIYQPVPRMTCQPYLTTLR